MKCVLAVFLCLFPLLAHAATCTEHFPAGAAPTSSAPLVQLCNSAFALGYSMENHEAGWAAEHLTATTVRQAMALEGRDSFHDDTRLPVSARSEPYDYKRSGWSRGHLAASGDAPTPAARNETFALSNVVPQNASMNSGPWNAIERNLRRLTLEKGETYVVTGPAFRENRGTIGVHHVRVPSSLWKAIHVPQEETVAVLVCKNDSSGRCNAVSPDALTRVTGIRPFPGLKEKTLKRSPELERRLLP